MDKFLNLSELSKAIQGIANTVLDYALLLAAVGTIAMALLELIKSLLLLRAHYHQIMFRRWIRKKQSEVLEEFFVLATGEKSKARYLFWRAIFDQPSEKMLGQIQAAANVAMDYPNIYRNFYTFLTRGSETTPSIPGQQSDKDVWMNFVTEPSKDTDAQRSRQASQARARLTNLVARKLDAFQTNLEYWWARLNQTVAIFLGAAIFWYAIHQTVDVSKIDYFTLVVMSALGGLVSPFAKDIVSALSGLRTRRG